MLVVNTSQPQRLYTNPLQLDADAGSYCPLDPQGHASRTTVGRWYDLSNKYIYFVRALAAAPWLAIQRFTYDTNGVLGSKTTITLSGFGTFSSTPFMATFQGGQSANFYLVCQDAGGSANFTANDICTVSISGTTATKGANLSVPTVASYDLNRCFAVGAVVYAFYSLTASPYTCDVGRKYSGSWSTLSGAALPSSTGTVEDDSFPANGLLTAWGRGTNIQKTPSFGGGTSFDKFYNSFARGNNWRSLKFDAATDTWSASTITFEVVFAEINGQIILHHSIQKKTTILNTSLAVIGEMTGFSFGGLSNSDLTGPIMDLENGIWEYKYGTVQASFSQYYKGVAKRIGKVMASDLTGVGIMYKIDSNNWSSYIPNTTAEVPELNYYGETTLKMFVYKTTGSLKVEITD